MIILQILIFRYNLVIITHLEIKCNRVHTCLKVNTSLFLYFLWIRVSYFVAGFIIIVAFQYIKFTAISPRLYPLIISISGKCDMCMRSKNLTLYSPMNHACARKYKYFEKKRIFTKMHVHSM